jgi:hypothetical protein
LNSKSVICENMDWIHLPQDRAHWEVRMNTLLEPQIPLNERNFVTSLLTVSFCEKVQVHQVIIVIVINIIIN